MSRPGARARWRGWLGNAALVLGVLLAAHLWQTRAVPSGPAPPLTAPTVDGRPLSLTQWRAAHPGQPVALHFWAEWCPICKLEEHSIGRVAADAPVLGVAMQSGDGAQVARVMAQRGLHWPTLIDADGQQARAWGVRAVPAFIVIAPDGRISSASVGYTSELGMRARLWWARWGGGSYPKAFNTTQPFALSPSTGSGQTG